LQNAEHIASYCTYHAHSVVRFSAFLALIVSPAFFLLGFAKLYGFLTSWLCLCSPVHRNQRHKRQEITNEAYTQTKTTTSTVVGVFATPTTTTTATATTKTTATSKATTTRNYYYNYNCSYKYKNYTN